jgi:ParB/RepB/Spo0J family partition protein
MVNEKMKLRHVKPGEIQIPEVRVTSIWTEDEYEDFVGTIKEDGIQQPLKCILEDGVLWLIDGLHRLDEAKRLGIEKVPVVYKEGKLVDALVENLTSNRLRGKTPIRDEIRLIKHLRDEYNMEPWQIAGKTGLPRERIEQRLQVGTAAPEVLSCLEFEQIPLGTAFQLSRLPNEGGQIALLGRLLQATPPATVKEVTEIVESALAIQEEMREAPVQREVMLPTKTLACHLCGEMYEASDMRGINIDATCHGLARDYIQELKKKRERGMSPSDVLANRIASEEDVEASRALLAQAGGGSPP